MKRIAKRSCSFLLILTVLLGLAVTAFAADSAVTFKSLEEGFDFQPGSEYTASDLFDTFKNAMPGDTLTQNIVLKNEATDCGYINLYLRAEVHDEEGNPLSEKVAENETVASMQDFLSQLSMRIYNGDELIYEASPEEAGALVNNVFLGSLKTGEALNLKVELEVPAELDNQYANRVGEVDWIFLAEGIVYSKLTVHKVWDDNSDPQRPERVKINLLKDGEAVETVTLNGENQWTYTWDELDDRYVWSVEEEAVEGYEASYKIEDNTVFITNHNDYVPTPPPEPVELTVKKVWSDEDGKNGSRPDSVTVTLYNGDTAVEKVTLSAKNNWTYTWKDLDGSGDWSVLETGIPKGYTPSYSSREGVVTITNTATLIQTGQLNWPIPVLSVLGLALIVCGVLLITKKRRDRA